MRLEGHTVHALELGICRMRPSEILVTEVYSVALPMVRPSPCDSKLDIILKRNVASPAWQDNVRGPT